MVKNITYKQYVLPIEIFNFSTCFHLADHRYSCSLVVAYKLRRRWSNALVDYMVTLTPGESPRGGFLNWVTSESLRDSFSWHLMGQFRMIVP